MKHKYFAGAFLVALAVTTPQLAFAHVGVDEASTLLSGWHSLAHATDALLLPGLIAIGIVSIILSKRQERGS